MGVPYESFPHAGIVVGGGQTITVALPHPARAWINKLVVVQTDGAQDDFVVELFNHADALEGTPGSESASDSEGAERGRIPLDCFRVSDVLVGRGGRLLYFSEEANGGTGWMFVTQDRDPDGKNRVISPRLYVRISPNGTGQKTFVICVGGESAQ